MIKFENVTKVYDGGFKAVKEVNFEVKEGELVSLIGSNGAGSREEAASPQTSQQCRVHREIPPDTSRGEQPPPAQGCAGECHPTVDNL